MRSLIVTCTAATETEGRTIARALVEERLAACVQRLPIASCYRWQDAIEEAPEQLLLIKTTNDAYPVLERRILELHSYETPEIIAIEPAAVSAGYLAWLETAVGISDSRFGSIQASLND